MNNTSTNKILTASIHLTIAVLLIFAMSVLTHGQGVKPKTANTFASPTEPQQPLYSSYKGVSIGMTEQEVHGKLGNALKIDDSDFYVFSDTETAQILYDHQRKVSAISIDYVGGVGAPDYKAVVGNDILTRPDGSMYKIIHYQQLGFWVSYSRTGKNSTVTTVSITIQKILQ